MICIFSNFIWFDLTGSDNGKFRGFKENVRSILFGFAACPNERNENDFYVGFFERNGLAWPVAILFIVSCTNTVSMRNLSAAWSP